MFFQIKSKTTCAVLALAALAMTGCDSDSDLFVPRDAANMSWILVDDCDDGRGLEAALFDTDNGIVFPSTSRVYVSQPGGEIRADITCERRAQICYGAGTDPASDLFWGVGVDGNEGCDDCCDLCDDVVVEFVLFCSGPGAANITSAKRGSRSTHAQSAAPAGQF